MPAASTTALRRPPRARDGRVLGDGGLATRALLLENLYRLLAFEGFTWRRVGAIEVARASGVSGATFFQYFPEIEAAFDEMYEQRRAERRPIVAYVHGIARLRAAETGRGWTEPQEAIDFEEQEQQHA